MNPTLRQIKERIKNLTVDEMRSIMGRQDAEMSRESWDGADFYDVMMDGYKGFNQMSDAEVRDEFKSRHEDMPPEDLFEELAYYLDQ